jgi:hypothetical protein
LPLLFIDSELKIDQHYYIKLVLQDHLLKHAQHLYGEDYFCFQKDLGLSHKATPSTQEWLSENVQNFLIPKLTNTASSPDLNRLDYFAWGYAKLIKRNT